MELAFHPPPLPTTRPQATPALGSLRLRTPVGLKRSPSRPDLAATLGDTEHVAAQVARAATTDPFAAAVVAYRWLGKVRDVEPHMFEDDRAQRAWAEAWCVLDGVARSSRRDARLQEEVARYLACKDEVDALDRELGPDPLDRVEAARGRHLQAVRVAAWRAVFLICAVAPALFCLVAGLALGSEGRVLTMAGALLALPATIASCTFWGSARAVRAAETALLRTQALVRRREAFLRSAQGGGFLCRVGRRHPLVRLTVAPRAA